MITFGVKAALHFVADIGTVLSTICTHPGLGREDRLHAPRFRSIRSFRVSQRFRDYLILYEVRAGRGELIRILHGARDLAGLFSLGEADGGIGWGGRRVRDQPCWGHHTICTKAYANRGGSEDGQTSTCQLPLNPILKGDSESGNQRKLVRMGTHAQTAVCESL